MSSFYSEIRPEPLLKYHNNSRMSAPIDLVNRGKKDAYFLQNAQRTWFGTMYERRAPSAKEDRIEHTLSPASFGNWVDIHLPRTGDILLSTEIRIQLPTWLPPSVAAQNYTEAVTVESATTPGTFHTYGWTNGIANYCIRRWALFADNLLLQEGWGEENVWYPDSTEQQHHVPILHTETGTHDGASLQIQRSATPPEVLFRVPIVSPLPLCAIQQQRLFLRLWITEKTELVESAQFDVAEQGDVSFPLYELCPAPWGGRRIKVNNVLVTDVTLQEYEMGPLYVYGRFTVLHIEKEEYADVLQRRHEIPFKQQKREEFTIEDRDWNPEGIRKKRVELHGLFQNLTMRIRAGTRQRQNKLRDYNPPGGGEWLQTLSFFVNGVERIFPWPPKKFQELAQNIQLRRDVNTGFYLMYFGPSEETSPAGDCNVSGAHKTLLIFALEDVPADPMEQTNQAYVMISGQAWNLLEIQDGVVRVTFSS
jgi:hypothetical protein